MARATNSALKAAKARGRAKATENTMRIGMAIVTAQGAAMTLGRPTEVREIEGERHPARFIVRDVDAPITTDSQDVFLATWPVVRFGTDGKATL